MSRTAHALGLLDAAIRQLDGVRRSIVRKLATALLADDRVNGLMLGGSIARGISDAHSDVDLVVSLSHHETSEAQITRMVECARRDPSYVEHSIARHLRFFGDLLSVFYLDLEFNVDLGFLGPKELERTPLEPYGAVLFDPQGTLQHAKSIAHESTLSRSYDEEIWISLWKVLKAVERGDQWRANEYLNRARRATAALLLIERGLPIRYEGREDHGVAAMMDVSRFAKTWPGPQLDTFPAAALTLVDLALGLKLVPRVESVVRRLRTKFESL